MTDACSITLGLGGRWFGRYGQARCPAHEDRRPSLSLANGTDGQLLAHCHAGCEFSTILDGLRSLGLVEGSSGCASSPLITKVDYRASESDEAKKREQQARTCWAESQSISGTLAEIYLRGRGITCALPDTLRFHPTCWHPTGRRLPALVALVDGADRLAVHRTYLRSEGCGKAKVEPSKAMLGTVAGGAVWLTEEFPAADAPLVVAEGIETALSLGSGLLHSRAVIWAALSTSGMAGLRLPARPGRLTIAADGDKPGQEAAHALASRAHALGWQVSLLPAPEGRDWNDVLMLGSKRERVQ